jgi:hypothetical protein
VRRKFAHGAEIRFVCDSGVATNRQRFYRVRLK